MCLCITTLRSVNKINWKIECFWNTVNLLKLLLYLEIHFSRDYFFFFFLRFKYVFLRTSNFSRSVIFRLPHQCFCSLHMHAVVANEICHGMQKVRSSYQRCSKKRDALSRNTNLCLRKQSEFWGN